MEKDDQNPKQGITYVTIPGEVAFNKQLNQTDCFVFWIIKSLDITKERCWASNEYIGQCLNINKQTVSNSINKLIQNGYLKQTSFNGRIRKVAIDNDYLEKYRFLIEEYNENIERLKQSLYSAYNDHYKQPISSLIVDKDKDKDNNKDKTIINDCMESDGFQSDNSNSPKTNLSNNPFTKYSIRLIAFWSSLGHTSVHKTASPYNKTCVDMVKKLNSLQKGTFFKCLSFDPDWIKKEKIPEKWFNTAWTVQEIKDAMVLASRYSLEGYPPQSDKTSYKSLANILYNPRQRISLLFQARKNPPLPILKDHWENPYPNSTKDVMKSQFFDRDYKFDEIKLSKGIAELDIFSKNLIRDSYNRLFQHYGTLDYLLRNYLEWLEEQNWITDHTQHVIGTSNKVFRKFIDDQENEMGLPIESKGWKK